MLGLSAAYNLWPVSPRKWLLRRFDHSAIYMLIAATYTPIISQIKDQMFAAGAAAGVWGVAMVGILLKLFMPGKFDKLSVGLYLAMGWSGLIAYDQVVATLPNLAMWFIARRRRAVHARRDLPRLAPAAVPERDLARLRAARAPPATTSR